MSECATVRGVDTQVDGDGGDALVGAGKPVSFCFNLQTDLLKVHKLTSLTVQELCILYEETVREFKERAADECRDKDTLTSYF